MQEPASRSWQREAIPRRDAETGVRVTQMTSAPMIHENIYPESPVFTPDSRCFIYSRRQALDSPREYWIADLTTNYVRRLTDEDNVKGPVVTPDGQWMYYMVEGEEIELKRLSLESFERETWMTTDLIHAAYPLGTIRHDGQAYITSGAVDKHVWAVVKFDLAARRAEIIMQTDQICNAHPQYARGPFNDVLIQENHGCQFDEDGRCIALTSGLGADLHVIADDGSNLRDVALGRSELEKIQGHQCWVGTTERVLSTLVRRDTTAEPFRSDRLVVITPGRDDREVVGRGQAFSHPSVSRNAKWWVSDEGGTADLFLGSMETHRYELLVHTGSSFGSPQYTHPHPAFSPDNLKVLYNSDVTGVPQVHVAWVDEGLLERLAP